MSTQPQPLEYSEEDVTVYDDTGVPKVVLNRNLLREKNIRPSQLEELKRLHRTAISIVTAMSSIKEPNSERGRFHLHNFFTEWTAVQFDLQEAWGFDRNQDYHASYYLPHCICPKLDNEDRYGTPYRVVRPECPIHGKQN